MRNYTVTHFRCQAVFRAPRESLNPTQQEQEDVKAHLGALLISRIPIASPQRRSERDPLCPPERSESSKSPLKSISNTLKSFSALLKRARNSSRTRSNCCVS